jgi:hypothetical protein
MNDKNMSLSNQKAVDEVMICPNCKGNNCHQYDTDETEFSYDGTGHYYIDCTCDDCGKSFRLCIQFVYSVTEAHTRA